MEGAYLLYFETTDKAEWLFDCSRVDDVDIYLNSFDLLILLLIYYIYKLPPLNMLMHECLFESFIFCMKLFISSRHVFVSSQFLWWAEMLDQ